MYNCRFGQNIMLCDAEFSDAYNNYTAHRLCEITPVSFTNHFTVEIDTSKWATSNRQVGPICLTDHSLATPALESHSFLFYVFPLFSDLSANQCQVYTMPMNHSHYVASFS